MASTSALHLTAKCPYDLLVGDETYEIAGALRRHPELKRAPFTLIYDFVGLDAMTRRPTEHLMAWLWNRAWCGGHAGKPPGADLVLFVGEPQDVADRRFGPWLPNRRAYARRYYQFVGYVFGFDPQAYADTAKVRAALGYDQRPLVVCSVGGTAVGADLLRLCAAAYPHIRQLVPDARMVLVCGPRLDPAAVRAPSGVEVRGYLPRLYEHLAACDVAAVQGGGTTTLELTALRRPFAYFPLEGHIEQRGVVAERLARHRAGQRLDYSRTTPPMLAAGAVVCNPAASSALPSIVDEDELVAASSGPWSAVVISQMSCINRDRTVRAVRHPSVIRGRPREPWYGTGSYCR